jgi:lipopolysaccharide transport system permease protein
MQIKGDQPESWDIVIKSKASPFEFDFSQLWHYRDLLVLMVKRNYAASFHQTILGPIWFFVQPLLSTLVYIFIFGKVAKIDIGTTEPVLFYFSSITLWTFFSSGLTVASTTFISNSNLFGKVYFPRLIVPLAAQVSNLLKLGVQMMLLMVFMIYFGVTKPGSINISFSILFLPFILVLVSFLSLGLGMIISGLTTKYRDLSYLVSFGVQLLMYSTPVIYPISFLSGNLSATLFYNPLTAIFESYRLILFGHGDFTMSGLIYSVVFTLIIFMIGLIVFNRTEKKFIDTV